MKFIKIADSHPVIDYLTKQITTALTAGKQVLWLVPGGSAISVAASVSKNLAGQDLQNLHVSLTDERYGPPGHADCNWLQLEQVGFSLPGANLYPVVIGEDRDVTTKKYAEHLEQLFNKADYALGFFGIGPDGHTAGILPGSPAVHAKELAKDYDANFQRITMTPPAIARLHEAVAFTNGEAKWPILDQLETARSLDNQPAQALKLVPTVTIFNDYQDGEITV